jgi:hypothetical protein
VGIARIGQEEQFASRKTSRSLNNYLIQGKIKSRYSGRGGLWTMATQAR